MIIKREKRSVSRTRRSRWKMARARPRRSVKIFRNVDRLRGFLFGSAKRKFLLRVATLVWFTSHRRRRESGSVTSSKIIPIASIYRLVWFESNVTQPSDGNWCIWISVIPSRLEQRRARHWQWDSRSRSISNPRLDQSFRKPSSPLEFTRKSKRIAGLCYSCPR